MLSIWMQPSKSVGRPRFQGPTQEGALCEDGGTFSCQWLWSQHEEEDKEERLTVTECGLWAGPYVAHVACPVSLCPLSHALGKHRPRKESKAQERLKTVQGFHRTLWEEMTTPRHSQEEPSQALWLPYYNSPTPSADTAVINLCLSSNQLLMIYFASFCHSHKTSPRNYLAKLHKSKPRYIYRIQ